MRVGINGRHLTNKKTGVGQYLSQLLSYWTEDSQGYHFFLFLPFPKSELSEHSFLDHPSVEIIEVPKTLRGLRYMWWYNVTLPRLLARYQVSSFFSADYFLPIRLPCPGFMTIHDVSYLAHPEWFSRTYRLVCTILSKKRAPYARTVFTVSQYSKNEILKYIPSLNASSICITPLAVGPEFSPLTDPNTAPSDILGSLGISGPYFLFVGKLLNRRHVDTLIHAFTQFQKKYPATAFQLAIRGENESHPYIDFSHIVRGANNALSRRAVLLIPRRTDAELITLYQHAYAFFYISDYEGFGLPVLEAMACGIPTVTSPVTSLPEVAGDSALFITPHDTATIVTAMKKLTDQQTHATLRAKGLERAAHFNWRHTAEVTLNTIAGKYADA